MGSIVERAEDLRECRVHSGSGTKRVALFFMDPSTRTRLSFQAAAMELGWSVLDCGDMTRLQVSKGESLMDTGRMVGTIADFAVFRGAQPGALVEFTAGFRPGRVINAGCDQWHPTQAVADLLTLKDHGLLSPRVVTFVGAPVGRRAQCSFLKLIRDKHVQCDKIVVISELDGDPLPPWFGPDERVVIRRKLDLSDAHLVYLSNMARPQAGSTWTPNPFRVRAFDLPEGSFVMHPLARHEELSTDVDDTPHNLYFRQMENLLPARMAVLSCAG